MHYSYKRTHTIKRGEKVRILIWYILPPVCLHMPDSAASPNQQLNQSPKTADLPLQGQVDMYNHLAAVIVPSIGLEDIIAHIESFTKFTQQALNASDKSI